MTLNLTRGGLSPGKITNLSTGDEVKFMFNPYEYSITKTNQWDPKPVTGQNIPRVIFSHGGAQSLTLTLYFDSLPDGTDVRQHTVLLWKMMMVDESTRNEDSDKSAPPAVAFEWGRLYFKAIITTMTEKFTLFKADGTPLRCNVTVTLQQFLDDTQQAPQTSGQTSSQSTPTTTTVVQGDRIDHIANNSTGSPSNWRNVAETNNVNDPLNMPSGQTLNTPRRS